MNENESEPTQIWVLATKNVPAFERDARAWIRTAGGEAVWHFHGHNQSCEPHVHYRADKGLLDAVYLDRFEPGENGYVLPLSERHGG